MLLIHILLLNYDFFFQGTKINGTLFNEHIETFGDSLQQSKVCYIINSRINWVNPNFQSVNKDIELVFLTSTIVQECHDPFSTFSFSKNFVPFVDEILHTKETIVGNSF